MEEEGFIEYLRDVAHDLAEEAFENPSNEHIEAIVERLKINYQWGLINGEGATTVH